MPFLQYYVSRQAGWLWGIIAIGALSIMALAWDNPVFQGQPFRIAMGKDHAAMLLVEMRYSQGQNATLVIEPKDGCVTQISLTPADIGNARALPETVPNASFCGQRAIPFAPYLYDGLNVLHVEMSSTNADAEVYISPQLLGAHFVSTAACLGVFAAAAAILFHIAGKAGLSPASAAIIAAGFGYYALWLHFRPNLTYTNDVNEHISYIRYMVWQWMRPYDYNGGENWHPPLYYFIAARVFDLFRAWGLINPLTAVRLLSLALYSVFCIYGVRTLRESVEAENLAYYAGSILMVFWPVGMIMATRINNDVAVYAVWAAAFYYLARWHRTGDVSCLYLACGLTELTLMIKSNGYVLACIVASCMTWAVVSKRLAWRQLFVACALLVGGMAANAGRLVYKKICCGQDAAGLHFGGNRWEPVSFHHFAYVDVWDMAVHPFVMLGNEPSFWNYFLKSMLYGEFEWQHQGVLMFLPAALNLLLLAFLIITFCGMVISLRKQRCRGELLPYLASVAIPLAAMIAFMAMKRFSACQDFRFVLPMLIPLVMLFVRGMENLRAHPAVYWLGMSIGLCLPVGGMMLYLGQYVH